MRPAVALLACLALALLSVEPATAQVPRKIDYQAMITDEADEPLANQAVTLDFSIFDAAEDGTLLWSEEHNATTNSVGVVSVLLGETAPLALDFDKPLWLQVEIQGELLMPRRELAASPFALHAADSDRLGGAPAEYYVFGEDLFVPGSINDPGNPVDWTNLKNMPTCFADGLDDAGTGDGHSLDAADGDPADVLYVTADGLVQIGGTPYQSAKLSVVAGEDQRGGWFRSTSEHLWAPAIAVKADSTHGVLANSGIGTYITPGAYAAITGIGGTGSHGGLFLAYNSGNGVTCEARGSGDALQADADQGYSGYFTGGNGIYASVSSNHPVAEFDNQTVGAGVYADAAWFNSRQGVDSWTYTVYCESYEGNTQRLRKKVDDDRYAVYVDTPGPTSEGLYVDGTIVSTGSMARAVETSRGTAPVFAVSAADVEVVASGKGRLSNGKASVAFDDVFTESISGPDDLRVTATPIGGWSALYVERLDHFGFAVRSAGGDRNVEFHWVAIGRSAGHERRPEITLPDRALEREIEEKKTEELRSRRGRRGMRENVEAFVVP